MSTESYDYAVQMNRYSLSMLGAWQISKEDSFFMFIIKKALNVLTYAMVLFNMIPCVLYTFYEEADHFKRILWYGPISFFMMGILKFSSLLQHTDKITKCHDHVKSDWELSENDPTQFSVMIRNAKFGRFLAVACATFMYGGVLFYSYVPTLTISKGTQNVTVPKPFPFAVYSKWIDVQRTPTYEFIYCMQIISVFYNSTITVSICSIAAAFVMHTCGQLQIVMSQLHDLINGPNINDTLLQNGIRSIVKRHLRALSFASRIEKILSWICLVEFFGCTLNMCLLGYYVITNWESRGDLINSCTYAILFTSFIINIFVICYMGEVLSDQCRKVGEATYAVDWYRVPGNKSLDLVLIILMSSFPVKMTAGKIIELSYVSFSSALKTSAVYLNLLRKVTA